jgi:hypothetical protein
MNKIEFYKIYVFENSRAIYIPIGLVDGDVEYIEFVPGLPYSQTKINVDKYHNKDWYDRFATNYHYSGELLRDDYTFQQIQKLTIEYILNIG